MTLADTTMAAGGAMLVLITVAVEPGAADVLRGAWGIEAWLGWLFLMLFGSVVADIIHLRLLRHCGRWSSWRRRRAISTAWSEGEAT